MPILYSRLRNLTTRQIVRALLRDGFELRRGRGGHRQYAHVDGRRVTIPFHRPSDTFRLKTLSTIIERQAKWTEDDLRRLKLLK